jgi:hypothetical protein
MKRRAIVRTASSSLSGGVRDVAEVVEARLQLLEKLGMPGRHEPDRPE